MLSGCPKIHTGKFFLVTFQGLPTHKILQVLLKIQNQSHQLVVSYNSRKSSWTTNLTWIVHIYTSLIILGHRWVWGIRRNCRGAVEKDGSCLMLCLV